MHPIQKTKHGLTFEAHLVVFHIHLPDPRARIKQKGIATMVGILERWERETEAADREK
jgi:hypothetical protein